MDRAATARKIAERHYAGFSAMSAAAQAKVTAYVESQLPATIAAGTQLATLHAHIVLADAGMSGITQITDYSLRRIGVDGMPTGSIQSHVVRSGDTLQSVAAIHFGSPSYWYLIAEANGLQGHEVLAEGTTLAIPNKVVNAANSADTFKVYNESEIIGSTSPEIRTIKKKKKWYQKLIMILIVVIMIVAAVMTAGAALAAMGPAYAGALASLGTLGAAGAAVAGSVAGALGFASLGAVAAAGIGASLAVAAVAGAAIYATANVLSQGLAVASGLQESFEWRQVGKAAITGAVTGVAAGLMGPAPKDFSWAYAAKAVAVEAGKQLVLNDGKITNVGGLMMAAAGAGALKELGFKDAQTAFNAYRSTVGAGLALLENKVRGRGDNAMLWVGLATSAVFDSGMLGGGSGSEASPERTADGRYSGARYFDKNGDLNWKTIAVQTIGAAIVADRMGEDAALGYIGNVAGDLTVQGIAARDARLAEQKRKDALYGLTGGGTGDTGLRVGTRTAPRLGAGDDSIDEMAVREELRADLARRSAENEPTMILASLGSRASTKSSGMWFSKADNDAFRDRIATLKDPLEIAKLQAERMHQAGKLSSAALDGLRADPNAGAEAYGKAMSNALNANVLQSISATNPVERNARINAEYLARFQERGDNYWMGLGTIASDLVGDGLSLSQNVLDNVARLPLTTRIASEGLIAVVGLRTLYAGLAEGNLRVAMDMLPMSDAFENLGGYAGLQNIAQFRVDGVDGSQRPIEQAALDGYKDLETGRSIARGLLEGDAGVHLKSALKNLALHEQRDVLQPVYDKKFYGQTLRSVVNRAAFTFNLGPDRINPLAPNVLGTYIEPNDSLAHVPLRARPRQLESANDLHQRCRRHIRQSLH